MKFSKNVNNNKDAPKLIFFNEKKNREIQIIFDFESQKSGFFNRHLPNVRWSAKKKLWKSAIFYSIKLTFDAEVAEKILNCIYYSYKNLIYVWPFLLRAKKKSRKCLNLLFCKTDNKSLLLIFCSPLIIATRRSNPLWIRK